MQLNSNDEWKEKDAYKIKQQHPDKWILRLTEMPGNDSQDGYHDGYEIDLIYGKLQFPGLFKTQVVDYYQNS